MKDSYYTPPELAQQLVGYVRKKKLNVIADFCVGDGRLLRAAEAVWKTAEFIATDISDKALLKVKRQHPKWFIGKCDFQNKKSQNSCKSLKGRVKGVDLILLNPPFSCVGGTRHKVILGEDTYTSSTAMVFVVESLKYLSHDGCIYAILPCSVAYSEKDMRLWNKLVKDYKLKILGESSDRHFEGCFPNILFVSLNSHAHQCTSVKPIVISHKIKDIEIFRGKILMNTVGGRAKGVHQLVHSTNLQKHKIVQTDIKIQAVNSEVTGPALLFPRVGNPRRDKLCILSLKKTVVLSDCVIAIKTRTLSESKKLQKLILHNWTSFSKLYHGTGARYITIARIKRTLGIKK